MSKNRTLSDITLHIQGVLEGDGDRVITGIGSLKNAGGDDMAFLENAKYRKDMEQTSAGAVLLGWNIEAPEGLNVIRVSQPAVAWGQVVELLKPYQRRFTDISPDATIGADCTIAEGVGIAPGAYIGNRVRIGKGTEIYPHVTVGDDTVIGRDCRIYPGVHIYHATTVGNRVILHSGVVIGADGYGFAQQKTDDPLEPVWHRKIPQIGTVIIEDDVEIGANTTVDRGALEATIVGRGTKIDNLVMVAHNCRIGAHCLLVAQVGMSGSIDLGPYVTIAGQAGLAGHVKVGPGARIGAKAGVMKDVAPGDTLIGSPALPAGLARRAYAQIENLPEFRKNITELQKQNAELQKRLDALEGKPDAAPEDAT